MKALFGLLRKEIFHIKRDRRTLAVIVLLPIVQVVLFGFAIRTDVERVRLAIIDPSPDTSTLALRERFEAAGLFRVVAVLHQAADLEPLFRRGIAQEAVVFGTDFGARLLRGETAQIQLIVDSTEPNTGSLVAAYARAVIQSYAAELGQQDPALQIAAVTRTRFNPTRQSSNLFVPGLMAFVLTIVSSLVTAISLTKEKETGTIEALLVSPLRPAAIIVGKVLPYLVIGFGSAVVVLIEAKVVFDVPFRGSVALLLGETLLFILTSLALGILISARTTSQRVATMVALVGTMLPNMLLSGFIFPIASMPVPLQVLSTLVPGRWFVEIARGIMLKGNGWHYLWQETLVLGGMALLLLVAAMRSFKTRLE